MEGECQHSKTVIVTDDGKRKVCIVCDDVNVETTGGSMEATDE